jgi:anti-sigma factor RsiW
MQCRQAMARISAYIDGELDAASHNDLELHLRQCPQCRAALNELLGVDHELRSLRRAELGPDFSRRLITVMGECGIRDRADVPGVLTAIATSSGLVEGLRDLFGLATQSGNSPLDEFNDFPPLSMGSVYFNIFGQSERG